MPLDPQARALLDQMQAMGTPALHTMSVPEARQLMESMGAFAGEGDAVAQVRDVAIPGPAGTIPARLYRPAADGTLALLIWFHGGGWVLGGLESHDGTCRSLANASGCAVLAIDYRLAPEHPFPAAVDDAVSAYRFVLAQGIAPGRIAIAGDSAGGGLTAATLLAIRDQKLPLPAAGALLSPWVDMEGLGESMNGGVTDDPMVAKHLIAAMAPPYLNGADPRTPLAAPLYADLRGLPPLLIQVGRRETLLDDSTRFAQRARRAGVDLTLDVWPGMIHVWQIFASELSEGREAVERIGEYLRKHFH
jgi:acetyl esterase/lipase